MKHALVWKLKSYILSNSNSAPVISCLSKQEQMPKFQLISKPQHTGCHPPNTHVTSAKYAQR